MFVSHDKNIPKKKNQKPNILRRKPKNSFCRISKLNDIESSKDKSLFPTSAIESVDYEIKSINNKQTKPFCTVNKVGTSLNAEKILKDVPSKNNEIMQVNFQKLKKQGNLPFQGQDLVETILQNNNRRTNQSIISINSLQDKAKQVNVTMPKKYNDQRDIKEYNISIHSDSRNIVIEKLNSAMPFETTFMKMPLVQASDIIDESTADITSSMVPLSSISLVHRIEDSKPVNEELNTSNVNIQVQNVLMEDIIKSSVVFKCDIDNCNKVFSAEQRLIKHKMAHNKDRSVRQPRQSTVECPVKKTGLNGVEERCGYFFKQRDDLIRHLNVDHTPDDAAYVCGDCGRHFFWGAGLRAHARTHGAGRRALACGWPGCDRQFRQPCRLREHARAHTGDRPYPCTHPNCGWSFRTASKLMRHARRHTDERRHVCAACGRAFLRREHLRDHASRHHAARAHACPAPDCQQTFTNMSSLYMHLKKVHKNEEISTSTVQRQKKVSKANTENVFMLNLLEPGNLEENNREATVGKGLGGSVVLVGEQAEGSGAGAGQSARTHCTWPLPRAPAHAYVLEEDAQVEQSEGGESNIYTVRSDLFLHGNVIHSEDSEHMPNSVRVSGVNEESETGLVELSVPSLDADMLLDVPTVDLAQEELYTDAVDESSFRVFLLSGEELA